MKQLFMNFAFDILQFMIKVGYGMTERRSPIKSRHKSSLKFSRSVIRFKSWGNMSNIYLIHTHIILYFILFFVLFFKK